MNLTTVSEYFPDIQVYNGTNDLADILNNTLLIPYADYCSASIINNGFMSIKINGTSIWTDHVNNLPMFFVSCLPSNQTNTYMPILENIPTYAGPIKSTDKTMTFLLQDDFANGTLLITFLSGFICFGSWMIFVVLLLLPASNHNSKRKLVHVYVLVTCSFESGLLGTSLKDVFKPQYLGNYQDATIYEKYIILSVVFRVGELLISFLCFTNWINIIYYMHHNSKKITAKWIYLPKAVRNNRNKFIICFGALLTVVDGVFFGLILWCPDICAYYIVYKIIESICYVTFVFLIGLYIWNDFGYILNPNHVENKDSKPTFKQLFKVLWKDYHDTVPVLIYNFFTLNLLFFIFYYLIGNSSNKYVWRYGLLRFIKLIVTVNTWGVIGIFERKESILSKETVLGRKISNLERSFVNPNIQYSNVDAGNVDDMGSYIELDHWGNSMEQKLVDSQDIEKNMQYQHKNEMLSCLNYPKEAWSSHLKVFQDQKRKLMEKKFTQKANKALTLSWGERTSMDASESNIKEYLKMPLDRTNERDTISNDVNDKDLHPLRAKIMKRLTLNYRSSKPIYYHDIIHDENDSLIYREQTFTHNDSSTNNHHNNNSDDDDNNKNNNEIANVNMDMESIETELTRNVIFDHDHLN